MGATYNHLRPMRYVTIPAPRPFGTNLVSLADILAQLVTSAPQWQINLLT